MLLSKFSANYRLFKNKSDNDKLNFCCFPNVLIFESMYAKINVISSFDDTQSLYRNSYSVRGRARGTALITSLLLVHACHDEWSFRSKASSEGCGSRGASKLKSQVRARSAVQVSIARYERQPASRFITRHVRIENIT